MKLGSPIREEFSNYLNLESKLPNFSVGKLKSPTNIEG